MTPPNDPTGSHHDPLDAVIADYLEQVEAGAVPDREALLARHPELAERLREFFADFDRLDRQAAELRLAPGPDHSTDAGEQPGEPPRVRHFGDYELLEVIARGGMGVVYKARQTSLNRVVALKMILHGQLATPRDVARFRAEAEAAANLDHPNIVPIYEVGEHEGQHYYAMRFVEGAPLARYPRGDGRAEAGLVATLARAVHFAHQRGILHRDLKPSNVLVQQAGAGSAVPFITDFGLAKRLGSAGDLTASGEAPGTPRYMAPEQAAGRKDLTVAADVYSLGVVLYERLTGAPPFTSEDPLELYRQIREVEPPRPSGRGPGLDGDLETMCLKCLEKEPAKRYGSAEALAEDLERWLRGEPIVARAVGPLGRLRRWCRRNPAVAGLTGTVALALLAGTVTSSYFAVQAGRRATAEETERKRAQAAEANMERAVVRSPVRPMNEKGDDTVSPMELEALWEVAGTAEAQQRLRFLAEMLGTEANANQLRGRMEWVVHSAVGLDPQLREEAERLLVESMQDPNRSLRHRAAIAWGVLELSETGSASQRASVEVIGQGWASERDRELLGIWHESLLRRTEGLVAGDAVRLLTQAFQSQKDYAVLEFPGFVSPRAQLAEGLASAAGRLEPAEASRILSQALEKETDAEVRSHLAEGLASVAGRLEPAEAARVCGAAARILTQALEKEMKRNYRDSRGLAEGLASVAGRLEPAETARILTQALQKQENPDARQRLAKGLASVAGRLGPAEAARMCGPAARVLMQALDKEKGPYARGSLAVGLAAVGGCLEPAEAARVCAGAARILTQALEKETDYQARYDLARGLVSVAGRLESAEAARILTKALGTETDPEIRSHLAEGLASVAGRLEPAEAARILTQALEKEEKPLALSHLAEGLASVAGRLEPAEAAHVCGAAARILTQALEKETKTDYRDSLAEGLASVAGRLEPAEAARICAEAARVLMQALDKEKDSQGRRSLAKGLAAVRGCLEPAEAARVGVGQPVVRTVVRQTASEGDVLRDTEALGFLLSDATRPHVQRRAVALTAAVGNGAGGPLASLPLLPAAREPLPCWLGTQDLVELLKLPTCVRDVRRVVLDQFGNRFGRRFATHWDFVRYAQEQGLNLDFTTPPQRPD
jgi:tRNA A-37 threonylcarbamoyl transferase component Bud32